MRICLVRLPSPYLINEKAFPPLGLLSVATGLKESGHDVVVHDGSMDAIPTDFQYYGVGPSVTEYSDAVRVACLVRESNPKARIVIGGPHATLNVEECLKDGFDCVVVGDGEFLAESAFFNEEMVVVRSKSLPLDNYPFPDRSFIDIKSYTYYINGELATPIVSAKGCPFKCGFCSKVYPDVRIRGAASVIQEIDYLHYDLGYKAVMFFDDIFILNKNRVKLIAKHLYDLGMVWRCLVRGDLVVKAGAKFIRMMRDYGCVEVGIGIESGSNNILANINKGEDIDTIRAAIKLLKDNGIRVKGFFIIGLPGEDEETIDETEKFVAEVGLDDMDFSIFKPYAGSPIYKSKEDYDVQWDQMDYSETFYKGNGRHAGGNIRTSSLTNDQIVNAMYRLEATYKYAS